MICTWNLLLGKILSMLIYVSRWLAHSGGASVLNLICLLASLKLFRNLLLLIIS